MKLNYKNIISAVIFVLIIIIIFLYIKANWPQFQIMHISSWWALGGLFFATLASFYFTALFFDESLRPYRLRLSFREYFGLTMITLMGNYLFPFSGLGFRAIYMKKVYNLSYRHFLITVAANWLTNFWLFSLAGLLALGYFYHQNHQFNWLLGILFMIVLVISSIAFLPLNITSRYRLFKKLTALFLDWQTYLKDKKTIERLFGLTFWQFIFSNLVFYFGYVAFGFKVGFIHSSLPTVLSLFSSVIRLVPASIGFYEATVVYPSTVLGLTIPDGLAVSFITRLATIFWTFALGLLFSYILINKKETKIKKPTK